MLSFNFSPFPALETERLLLKQITGSDAEALFEMRADKEVMKYIDRPLAQSIDDALALIKLITDGLINNDAITWGIFSKSGPMKLAGTIGFWQIKKEHHRAEIGYLLHPSLQGKGLMKEAIKKVLDHGFSVMKLHSVEANTNPDNTASRTLLEKTGFVQEAYFKENYYANGRFLDSAIYSILTPHRDSYTGAKSAIEISSN